jgi:hypothetical protein
MRRRSGAIALFGTHVICNVEHDVDLDRACERPVLRLIARGRNAADDITKDKNAALLRDIGYKKNFVQKHPLYFCNGLI